MKKSKRPPKAKLALHPVCAGMTYPTATPTARFTSCTMLGKYNFERITTRKHNQQWARQAEGARWTRWKSWEMGGKRKGREQGRGQCSGSVVATANGVSEQHLANVCVCPSVLPHSCSSLHWYATTFSLFSRAVHNHAKRSHLISAWSSRNGSGSNNKSENRGAARGATGKATAAAANNVAYFLELAVDVDAAAAAVIVDAGDLGLARCCQSCWTFNFRFSFTRTHKHTERRTRTLCVSEIGWFFVVVCNICWLFWRCLFFALYLTAHGLCPVHAAECVCVCVCVDCPCVCGLFIALTHRAHMA